MDVASRDGRRRRCERLLGPAGELLQARALRETGVHHSIRPNLLHVRRKKPRPTPTRCAGHPYLSRLRARRLSGVPRHASPLPVHSCHAPHGASAKCGLDTTALRRRARLFHAGPCPLPIVFAVPHQPRLSHLNGARASAGNRHGCSRSARQRRSSPSRQPGAHATRPSIPNPIRLAISRPPMLCATVNAPITAVPRRLCAPPPSSPSPICPPSAPPSPPPSPPPPRRLFCAIQSCNKPAYVDERPDALAVCCSQRHQLLHTVLQQTPVCAIAECTRPVHIDEQAAIVHEYCDITHARLAAARGESWFSQGRPAAVAGAEVCAYAGCDCEPIQSPEQPVLWPRSRLRPHRPNATGTAGDCSTGHAAGSATLRCALPSCNRLVYADNRPGYTATYCSDAHQQFHLALFHTTRSPPDPTQPTTPAAACRPTSTPAVLVCAIPSCQNPAFINTLPGHLALCCSNRHQLLYTPPFQIHRCAAWPTADCSSPVLIVADTCTVHDYCCYDHALLARDRGEVCFSQDRPIAPAGTNACVHPGCIRKPVDFSIFLRPHARLRSRAGRP